MKLYILCLFVICGCFAGQIDDNNSDQDNSDAYDEFYDYNFLQDEGENIDKEQKQLADYVEKIKTFHDQVRHGLGSEDSSEYEENHQPENSKEDVIEKEGGDSLNLDSIETLPKKEEEASAKENSAEKRAKEAQEDYALLWGDNEPAPLPAPIADDKVIFKETQEILNEDDDVNDFDEEKKEINLPVNDQSNLEEIYDETKKLLADNENDFDLPKTSSEKTTEAIKEIAREDDTADNEMQELDEDLRRLFEIRDKLSNDYSQEGQDTEEVNSSSVLDYEEKYGKPYHEGLVLSQRDDNDYVELMDSNLSEIFAKSTETGKAINSEDQDKEEPNPDDDVKEVQEKTSDSIPTWPIMYQNDEIVDETQKVSSDEVEEFKGEPKSALTDNTSKVETSPVESSTESSQRRTKMVEDLSSAELDELMSQFAMVNGEDLDVHASGFSRNVAPIHITLSLDEPTVVTSPNYPNNYPTNNIIDWVLEGEGMGIEMNITSFSVNGAIGDYLLVKPGGTDDSGHEGLIFTYHLNSERRYRFGDVDKLFMRFEAKVGMSFTRGFSISFKMMTPLPVAPEDLPPPEAVLNPPSAVMTVNLFGISAHDFRDIREDFRQLVADMATEYISDNNIDPGMNTTIEITQITSHGLCNLHWPGHDLCVRVTFGVPLTYEEDMEYRLNEEDLQNMWEYIQKEEFKKRLTSLGIEEFVTPDDQSVLMLWLLIAAGVVISMALMAFALWRYSCFDDYTRMQNFSDTDSIKAHKKDLDLYPTPHQTLPPLYTENDYKWADLSKYDDSARVHMEGFANRNYTRDDLYDLDYEEEVPNSDRNKNRTRDFYSNV